MLTRRLEASVVHSICTQLDNLGWVVDETRPDNNVTQQRAKTEIQKAALREGGGNNSQFPDFVLYEENTTTPIGVIEAKRPGASLRDALEQAERYARPLNAPLVFAYNDTFVESKHCATGRGLKIDGEDVRQFINHSTCLRFTNEGPEILSAPMDVQISRSELIRIFKRQANFLREAGLQAGLERFGAFSDVLFLKLMDEVCQLREHAGDKDVPLMRHLRWSDFQNRAPEDRLTYVTDVVWPGMRSKYGDIFSDAFPIKDAQIFDDIVNDLSKFNFTGTDADVKGDAFEYFLKNAYQGIKIKDLGEYFTPRNIVRTMVSVADPKFGEMIYDPFCGTGGFLIEAFRYIALRIKNTRENEIKLKQGTVYGSEIAATARVARMNMILFGDGHSNVWRQDSFANPVDARYDVVLTNPPYSQNTRHGNLYSLPSNNGDAVAMQHCFQALKPDGRAAILVKDDFLTEGGDTGKVRDMILSEAKNVSVISLPRRLFEPYTPTKTSILYFEKSGDRNTTSFFVVHNVGHTFGARKKSILENDLPHILESVRHQNLADGEPDCKGFSVANDIIQENKNSLWAYDYKEVLPPTTKPLVPLGNYIEPSGKKFAPSDSPDEEFSVLGVSNEHGVFLNEKMEGRSIKQKYIKVSAGDLVYNPHRVNVGSIGLVSQELDGGIVSGIYVVFKATQPAALPPQYILWLLKSDAYLRIIRAYDTKGSVRANLHEEQLRRIKLALPTENSLATFMGQCGEIEEMKRQIGEKEHDLSRLIGG